MVQHDYRLMEAAVAVADELNFSRASHRLRITQSALTKRIADLENRFTLILFERDSQAVTLTEAGRAFVEHARLSILHCERAVQAARAAFANAETVLRVGKTPYGDPFLVSTILSLRLPLYPRLKIELASGYVTDLVQGVLSGRIDLALVTNPAESASLSMTKVAEEPLWVALSEESPLADCASLRLKDLEGCPWVVFARSTHLAMYDAITRQASERGIRWAELQEILAPEEGFQSIVEQNGVAVLTRSAALRIARDGVTMRPLAEQHLMLKTYLVCRSDNESKPVGEMVRGFGRKLRVLQEAA